MALVHFITYNVSLTPTYAFGTYQIVDGPIYVVSIYDGVFDYYELKQSSNQQINTDRYVPTSSLVYNMNQTLTSLDNAKYQAHVETSYPLTIHSDFVGKMSINSYIVYKSFNTVYVEIKVAISEEINVWATGILYGLPRPCGKVTTNVMNDSTGAFYNATIIPTTNFGGMAVMYTGKLYSATVYSMAATYISDNA